MRRKSLGVLTSFVLVLAACGGGDDDAESRGSDETVLQITSEGGFVPVEFMLNNGPRYTLLGDGRLIFQGVQTMQFPGPLLPPYLVAQLDDSQMTAVLAMVERIGLPDIADETDDSATAMVADASTDVITFWDAAGTHRYAVYALGLEESPTERNEAFLELIQTFDQFTAETESEPYTAEQVRIIAGPGTVDPAFEDVRSWPLDDSWEEWSELPNTWACRAFDSEVLESFGDANQATTWEAPEDSFAFPAPVQLLVRPLLPGEPGCP
jgi:hypothetical protein